MVVTSILRCAGCGWTAPPAEEYPFPGAEPGVDAGEPNPFIRYRSRLHSYRVARSRGVSDEGYVGIVRQLDSAIAVIDGRGFEATPWRRCGRLSDRLGFSGEGGVWVKDETGNVSGSHKARHLMGIMLYLQVLERTGLMPPPLNAPRSRSGRWPLAPRSWPLAIASCGNAALAAAVVARAAGRPLDVFVPPSAEAPVVARLAELGASVTSCPRRAGEAGDPSYLRFQEALAAGALPFCVQGSDNGLTIEGGETLAWEMIDALGPTRLDRLFVQVGGGALASACIQAFDEAHAARIVDWRPRVHAVQTQGGYPLARAYGLVAERIAARGRSDPQVVRNVMRFARQHRSQFMWPWEPEPRSVAHGILDDETYDWAAVVEGMLLTDGHPIVVDEPRLETANALACEATRVNVDHTGSAGLAGLLELLDAPGRPGPDERVAVIFSGAKRR
jgi:threonine synthase